ncbi:hypothetical protein OG948_02935 [Embleya sp. NBC_00888]|uniref:hypothetical protein n=1 Tax=Embleya sp. NBC_00888 TaxID=2975960 RepID=UPI00386F42AE|nr:hypothetical protein OG948_02935 [Embleya sp. NBC_00888]
MTRADDDPRPESLGQFPSDHPGSIPEEHPVDRLAVIRSQATVSCIEGNNGSTTTTHDLSDPHDPTPKTYGARRTTHDARPER